MRFAMNLLLKRVLLFCACAALGVGGALWMANELFAAGTWEKSVFLLANYVGYFSAWIIGDKIRSYAVDQMCQRVQRTGA